MDIHMFIYIYIYIYVYLYIYTYVLTNIYTYIHISQDAIHEQSTPPDRQAGGPCPVRALALVLTCRGTPK